MPSGTGICSLANKTSSLGQYFARELQYLLTIFMSEIQEKSQWNIRILDLMISMIIIINEPCFSVKFMEQNLHLATNRLFIFILRL